MPQFTYEIHTTENPLLPFRFRPLMNVTKRQSLPNWHEEIELLYCFEGEGRVQLGGESIPFEKGDVVMVNTRIPHFVESEKSALYCCLITKSDFLRENGTDPTTLRFESRIQTEEAREKTERVRQAFADYDPERFDGILQIRSAVLALFCHLCQHHATPSGETRSSEAVNAALSYLHLHFRENVRLDEIAAAVGVSKFHLSREFKLSTGRTLMETVMLLRLDRAKDLIEKGERVSAAARACGFSNLSYFTRSFQNQFHVLPSQLRKAAEAEA